MDIQPGQLVVLTGSLNSRKDAMLDLMTGYKPPASGSVAFDGQILNEYGARQLQRSTLYLPRRDVIYPLSARENILFGAHPGSEGDNMLVREAASLAGVSALQSKALEVPPFIAQSMSFNGVNAISPAALRELDLHSPSASAETLTPVEQEGIISYVLPVSLLPDYQNRFAGHALLLACSVHGAECEWSSWTASLPASLGNIYVEEYLLGVASTRRSSRAITYRRKSSRAPTGSCKCGCEKGDAESDGQLQGCRLGDCTSSESSTESSKARLREAASHERQWKRGV